MSARPARIALWRAALGHAEAQHQLAWAYHTGAGTQKDAALAAHWWRRASEQGYAEAQARLGLALMEGDAVTRDDAESVVWFQRAADQGLPIDAGSSFEELAKKYSTCPSGKRGGGLGEFGPGQMVKEFDQVVFKGELGKVHGPVKTQFGYHLIEITSRK